MDDLISRQAAIDAVMDTDWYHQNYKKDMVHGANSSEHQAWYKAEDVYKALEQLPSVQPEPPTDDCISRQAAIDALKNRWKKTRNYEGNGDDIAEECELYLKQVPSAQPERKKGEWKHTGVTKSYRFICSACGKTAYYVSGSCASTRNKIENICKYNFCPNCGADMRGEQNG